MVGMFVSIVTATLVSNYLMNKSKSVSLESLQKIASEYAKGLPMMVDNETQLEAIGAAHNTIIYSYKLVNMENSDNSLQGKIAAMKEGMVNRNCTTPETRDNLLEKGVTMKYDYFDKNRSHIIGIEIKHSDCL